MPIEDVSNILRMPRLGKIHLGIKVEGQQGKTYPRATDHFVVPGEIEEVYGTEPKELDIMFPCEDVHQFAQQWLRRYSMTQGLTCIGDGVSARRKIDVETGAIAGRDTREWEWKDGLTCNPQECEEYIAKRCRRVMNLQVLLPSVPGLGVWQVDTSSFYSIVNINSMVTLLRNLAGRCSFIPLKLCLGSIQVTPAGQKTKKVHVLHVRQDATLAEIARIGLRAPAQALLPEPDTEAPDDLFPEEVLETGEPEQEAPTNEQLEQDSDEPPVLEEPPTPAPVKRTRTKAPPGPPNEPTQEEYNQFWTTAHEMGYTANDVTERLGISLDEWLRNGKTLEEALVVLKEKRGSKDEQEQEPLF